MDGDGCASTTRVLSSLMTGVDFIQSGMGTDLKQRGDILYLKDLQNHSGCCWEGRNLGRVRSAGREPHQEVTAIALGGRRMALTRILANKVLKMDRFRDLF